VNHSTPAEKVFEVALYDPTNRSREVSVYRGERIPSLYASPDSDADGIRDRADNCVNLANPLQRDANHDGIGNACDRDNDGVPNDIDNCPLIANPGQEETNGSGRGDACYTLPIGC
jgi:hypothetical protein